MYPKDHLIDNNPGILNLGKLLFLELLNYIKWSILIGQREEKKCINNFHVSGIYVCLCVYNKRHSSKHS